MDRVFRVVANLIFCLQILLVFLLFVEDRIALPPILQVAGRMHPLILHLPIGVLIFLTIFILLQKDFDSAYSHKVIQLGLLFTSLSASVAALFGFFLSLHGDYGGDVLMRHKIGGVILSWLCYILLLLHQAGKSKAVFLSLGGIACIILVLTGHYGAVLTHGENFILEPISKPAIILTADNSSAYLYAIAPILEKKCYSCHNESKAKGKLVMTDINKFIAGGEHGKPWIEGDPKGSRMIKAFYLPLDHDEHMPPDGKPQLNAIEIAALKEWIKSGADFHKRLDQYPDGDSLKVAVAALISKSPVQETEKLYSFEPASDDVIEKVNTPFLTVAPLYQGSPALQADFYVKKGFEIKSLEGLKAVRDQLVSMSLSRMPVSDDDLKYVSVFKNLEILNLNFSDIKGEGLHSLATLKNLNALSLAGTRVTAKSLEPVLNLPQLKEIYLWSTGINAVQRDSLQKKFPTVSVILSQFADESLLRLSKPMVVNEEIIKAGDMVTFKHPMAGVSIRYTTDGSKPDSLTGTIYEKPFALEKTTVVKAVGCKEGWYCSESFETICFVKGKTPAKIALLTPPDAAYPGEGVQSLTDNRKGVADVLKEPSWLGYQKNRFETGFSFEDKTRGPKEIVLSYGQSIYQHCFPPLEVQVWAGESKDKLKLIGKVNPEQPKDFVPVKVDKVSIPLDGASYKYYKLVAMPIPKLPTWFSKKGEKGWVFIDELFFY